MLSEDVLVEGIPDAEDLRQAIARAMGVAAGTVFIVSDPSEAPGPDVPSVSVVVEILPQEDGEFPTNLAFWPRIPVETRTRFPELRELSALLASRHLVDADTEDPYVHLRVNPDGRIEVVGVDTDAWDEDRYVVREVYGEIPGEEAESPLQGTAMERKAA